jgi:hypothetical protein
MRNDHPIYTTRTQTLNPLVINGSSVEVAEPVGNTVPRLGRRVVTLIPPRLGILKPWVKGQEGGNTSLPAKLSDSLKDLSTMKLSPSNITMTVHNSMFSNS